jgi:hypothetical protein
MRSPRRTAGMLISALATVVLLGAGEGAHAACYGPGEQLSGQTVLQFINNPSRLLTQYPSGGPQMISLIRDLVASDPGTLPLIINLDTKANPEQIQAIGTGLGQAALVCKRTAQAFANEIQQMTIATNNQPLTQAFAGVMGDQFLGLATPSVGGGGAGVTGQVGFVGGFAAGSAPLGLTTSVPTATGHSLTQGGGFAPASAPQGGGSSGGGSSGPSTLFAGNPGGLPGSISSSIPGTPGSPGTSGSPTNQSTPNANKPTSTSPSRP